MNRTWHAWLRSISGQLTLLAGAFVGAVVLAVVMVCLRDVLFEQWVRETYPLLQGWSAEAAPILAARNSTPAEIERLDKELAERIEAKTDAKSEIPELESIYGAWISDATFDPDGLLARRLTSMQPDWVVARLGRTFAAGSSKQRGRAVDWLRQIIRDPIIQVQVVELLRHARHQAETRGEEDLRRQAASVLAQEGAGHGVP